jgi:hypothetical protein
MATGLISSFVAWACNIAVADTWAYDLDQAWSLAMNRPAPLVGDVA